MIPIATTRRIIRETTGLRAGEETSKELAQVLEEMAETIAQRAGTLATHASRVTITAEDIRLAVQMLEEE